MRGRILAIRTHDISRPEREPRLALECDVEIAGARGRVLATHLGLKRAERRFQAGRILEVVKGGPGRQAGSPGNVALLGDVNEWIPWCAALRGPASHFGRWPSGRSYPTSLPLFPIDRIWSAPLGPAGPMEVVRTPATRVASDHYPVRVQARWIR